MASSGVGRALLVVASVIGCHARASGQSAEPPVTMVTHRPDDWLWLSGQVNLIAQADGTFTSPYAGGHSFRPVAERKLSRVLTLYTGARLGRGWELLFDLESAGGLRLCGRHTGLHIRGHRGVRHSALFDAS